MISFRLWGTGIHVEFGFIAVCALLSAVGDANILAYGFFAVILHEFAHLIVMMLLAMKAESIILHSCGIRICPKQTLCSYRQELIMLLAGPFANIAAWAAILYFSGNNALAQAQLIPGILNLLPCRFLDGGAALCAALSMTKIEFSSGERILRSVFIITPIFLIMLGFFFGMTNFTYYALMCYLLFSEFFR